MKFFYLVLPVVLCCACPAFAQPAISAKPTSQTMVATSPAYSNWRMIAESGLIVRGRLLVPVRAIRSRLKSKQREYEVLHLQVHQLLKGNTSQKTLAIRYFVSTDADQPSTRTVLSLHNKEVVAIMEHPSDYYIEGHVLPSPFAGQLFLAGNSSDSLQPDNRATTLRIQTEVQNQERIAANFSALPAARPDAFAPKVKALIEAMTHEKSEQQAFAGLEALGIQAVPSIIRLMNDRRRLPIPGIMLRNKARNAFEGARQYRPDVVVDAVAAILNQLVGESFGFIYNGASQRERQREVNGWRVFLQYRFSQNPKQPFTAPIYK